MRARAALLCLLSVACWKADYAELPSGIVPFRPALDGPSGWSVHALELPLDCPDGAPAQVFAVVPDAAAGPVPVAVIFHGGSFDYVLAPVAGPNAQYLEGAHYRDPSRLGAAWAANQVFATLGMRPGDDPGAVERYDGRLAVALADAGVAMVLPANCWGDLWANQNTVQTNDFLSDFFVRDGRTVAEWTYRSVLDEGFAAAISLTLPFTPDPTQTYLVGLGEGGRAVAELLTVDDDGDGTPTFSPVGAAVDSSPDDLRVFYDDAGAYAEEVEGLGRIYFDPVGPAAAATGSMWAAPLPERVAYLYSSQDPEWPAGVHAAGAARVDAQGGWSLDVGEARHVMLDGGADSALAQGLVSYLTTGVQPAR